MQIYRVRLFEIGDVPKELPGFTVDAAGVDDARKAARDRLTARGFRVRSLACAPGNALVVYVRTEKDKS